MLDPVYAGRGVPRGDGGPVLLIPGFLAGDSSMAVMAGWLERMGHPPHRSGIGWNVDCSDRALDALELRAERIVERVGPAARPVRPQPRRALREGARTAAPTSSRG